MEILGQKIANLIQDSFKKEIIRLKKKKKILRLTVFLLEDSPQQLSFVKTKAKAAKKLGIDFDFIHYKTIPSFEKFLNEIRNKVADKQTTGIVIQQPLPAQLSTDSIYEYIPAVKEIEGHRKKSVFMPPLGFAVLTVLKYILKGEKSNKNLIIDLEKDKHFFKLALRNKKVVLAGRGVTAGVPIGKTLTEVKINYISIDSKTPEPESYLKEADIIITAVGSKIIDPTNLKPGVILINAGLRREKGKLKGDYDEHEIKKIASYYTPTVGGLGPIDVAYLFKNLVDAAKLQR